MQGFFDTYISSAIFSPCRTFRYRLDRVWDQSGSRVVFIGLNPSTADEKINDNTITRLINYARNWGYGGIIMLNLFAFRATRPSDMVAAPDPIGPDNDQHILKTVQSSSLTVAAWGNWGVYLDRGKYVLAKIRPLVQVHCLRMTKLRQPEHALYLPKILRPRLFPPEDGP